MRSWMIVFSIGIIAVSFFPQLPPLWAPILLLIFSVVVFQFRRFRLISVLLFAFSWALFYAQYQLSSYLPHDLEGQDVLVTGWVEGLPQLSKGSIRFALKVDKFVDSEDLVALVAPDIKLPNKLMLSWYHSYGGYDNSSAPFQGAEMRPGQYWQFVVRLKRPHGYANPGGFDYEAWLLGRGIGATGYVREHSANRQLSASGLFNIDGYRQSIKNRLLESAQQSPFKGLMLALLIGDRQFMTEQQWKILQKTGTSHLMAISGLHIGLVAGLIYNLVLLLSRLGFVPILRFPATVSAAGLALLAAMGYAALAGFSLPTIRALVMVAVVMLSIICRRATTAIDCWLIALLVVLVVDPLAPLEKGFWLSFGAVGVLLFGFVGRVAAAKQANKMGRIWWKWGRAQWLIFIGLAPVLLVMFYQLPLLSLLANIIAIPVVSLIIVPLLFLLALLLSVVNEWSAELLGALDTIFNHLWLYLEWLAAWDIDFLLGAPSFSSVVFAIVASVLLLVPRSIPGRYLFPVFLLPMLLNRAIIPYGGLHLTVLDVGQGLSIVVQTQAHQLLYDAGPSYSSKFDTGKMVVVPFLRSQGVEMLDNVTISHSDNDHAGGFDSVYSMLAVGDIYGGMPEVMHLSGTEQAKSCDEGLAWQWDGVKFEVLAPKNLSKAGLSNNNRSCVLRVSSLWRSYLLTGDIERIVEDALVADSEIELAADVLIAPHHGSKTSSSIGFLKQVLPKVVVVSAGYRNRYHHPHESVLARYRRLGLKVFNTSGSGAISFVDDGSQAIDKPLLYRIDKNRFWLRE